MALYSDKVMDHFQNPRNVGKMDDADGVGEVGNAKCGDIMKMYIKVKDGIITDVKFNTFGCGSAIATSSMATELIKGKKVEDALELSNKAVVEALDGLPAHKIHCSVLAEEAVAAAVKDYYDRNGIAYDPELFSKKLLIGIAAAVAYFVLLKILGFVLDSIWVVFVMMALLLNEPFKKAWPLMLAVSILAPVVLYAIFGMFLKVPLPNGILSGLLG